MKKGRYGSNEGLTTSSCSGACARGYYCPAGSITSTANACPFDNSTSVDGTSDSSGCVCEAGSTGEDGGYWYVLLHPLL
jgi:hypothetical protein